MEKWIFTKSIDSFSHDKFINQVEKKNASHQFSLPLLFSLLIVFGTCLIKDKNRERERRKERMETKNLMLQ